MNLRKLLARCPNVAIALVPILVLAALIAALAISLAPTESAPIASEPSVPSSTELMDPTDPDAPVLADMQGKGLLLVDDAGVRLTKRGMKYGNVVFAAFLL